MSGTRSPEEVLRELDAVKTPQPTSRVDRETADAMERAAKRNAGQTPYSQRGPFTGTDSERTDGDDEGPAATTSVEDEVSGLGEKGVAAARAQSPAEGKSRGPKRRDPRKALREGESAPFSARLPGGLSVAVAELAKDPDVVVGHLVALAIEDLLVGDPEKTKARLKEYAVDFKVARAEWRRDQALGL